MKGKKVVSRGLRGAAVAEYPQRCCSPHTRHSSTAGTLRQDARETNKRERERERADNIVTYVFALQARRVMEVPLQYVYLRKDIMPQTGTEWYFKVTTRAVNILEHSSIVEDGFTDCLIFNYTTGKKQERVLTVQWRCFTIDLEVTSFTPAGHLPIQCKYSVCTSTLRRSRQQIQTAGLISLAANHYSTLSLRRALEVDLEQRFQKFSVYREQHIKRMLLSEDWRRANSLANEEAVNYGRASRYLAASFNILLTDTRPVLHKLLTRRVSERQPRGLTYVLQRSVINRHSKASAFENNVRKRKTVHHCVNFNEHTDWYESPSEAMFHDTCTCNDTKKRMHRNRFPPGRYSALWSAIESYFTQPTFASKVMLTNYNGGFADDVEVRRGEYEAAPERKSVGKREDPEKSRRPAASCGTIPTREKPAATQPGIEPGWPWWEEGSLIQVSHVLWRVLRDFQRPRYHVTGGIRWRINTSHSHRKLSSCPSTWLKTAFPDCCISKYTNRIRAKSRRYMDWYKVTFNKIWRQINQKQKQLLHKFIKKILHVSAMALWKQTTRRSCQLYDSKSGGHEFDSLSGDLDFGFPWLPESLARLTRASEEDSGYMIAAAAAYQWNVLIARPVTTYRLQKASRHAKLFTGRDSGCVLPSRWSGQHKYCKSLQAESGVELALMSERVPSDRRTSSERGDQQKGCLRLRVSSSEGLADGCGKSPDEGSDVDQQRDCPPPLPSPTCAMPRICVENMGGGGTRASLRSQLTRKESWLFEARVLDHGAACWLEYWAAVYPLKVTTFSSEGHDCFESPQHSPAVISGKHLGKTEMRMAGPGLEPMSSRTRVRNFPGVYILQCCLEGVVIMLPYGHKSDLDNPLTTSTSWTIPRAFSYVEHMADIAVERWGFPHQSIPQLLYIHLTTTLWSSAAMQERGKREIPEKNRRPAASSGTISTCENPGVTRPEIELGCHWWDASRLTAQSPRPQREGEEEKKGGRGRGRERERTRERKIKKEKNREINKEPATERQMVTSERLMRMERRSRKMTKINNPVKAGMSRKQKVHEEEMGDEKKD
ncbi:hypothetical protein PR048_025745 [Dryococelus australis]|uniref:Uncharacterized protein n=1 Tax=Dryococelus australis TaxID=614101 RepID=A0ABQ9GJD7_9NEOP|nr:hypothetical protein PR048_025745 [Dryococelus australis]